MAASAVSEIGGLGRAGPRQFTATVDPTTDNDALNNHLVGDVIYQTASGFSFECIDNTTAAAKWRLRDLVTASFAFNPTTVATPFYASPRKGRIIGINVRVEVAGTDGGAVTAVIRKASSGTALASGTLLHTGTANIKGTAATNQALTLSVTSTDLDLAAGDSLVFHLTGVMTSAVGVVTVLIIPL